MRLDLPAETYALARELAERTEWSIEEVIHQALLDARELQEDCENFEAEKLSALMRAPEAPTAGGWRASACVKIGHDGDYGWHRLGDRVTRDEAITLAWEHLVQAGGGEAFIEDLGRPGHTEMVWLKEEE